MHPALKSSSRRRSGAQERLKQRREGKRYLYRSAVSPERSRRAALRRLLATFFGGAADDAVAALLDLSAGKLTDEQWDRITQLIAAARTQRRGDGGGK